MSLIRQTIGVTAQAMLKSIPGMRALVGKGGQPVTGIAEAVIEAVNATDVDVRKELYGGVILTGAPDSLMLRAVAGHGRRAMWLHAQRTCPGVAGCCATCA
jgi:Actin